MSYILDICKFLKILLASLLFATLFSCHDDTSNDKNLREIEQLTNLGELKKAGHLADSLLKTENLSKTERTTLDSLIETGRRIKLDFQLTETDVLKKLSRYYKAVSTEQLQKWEKSKKLEMRIIDGEKRYFKNAVSNLFLLDRLAAESKVSVDGAVVDSLDLFCLSHTEAIINKTIILGDPVLPQLLTLTYTISVKPDVVPDGEMVRCWMPFPREGHSRQKNIRLTGSLPASAIISPENNLQRSIYLEQRTEKNKPVIFQVTFEVETSAQYFNPEKIEIKPYNKESEIYQRFTAERPPHIVFDDRILQLAGRIINGETNPVRQVEKIYKWINDSIKWASALEYSIIPDIPSYVIENRHGDCGMQTLLFMSLARSQGIPVKWQSGWMLHPGEVNLHDWCEVYYEGIGWVPLDQSFGLQASDNIEIRDFYIHGIDAYRLIVNDDYGQELTPRKKFMRSEPYDFQRGEVEWDGGNLYFDKWNWDMKIQYGKTIK